jgi:hypothetical protein
MTWRTLALLCVALAGLAPAAPADETPPADAPPPAQPGDTISWESSVPRAFERAAEASKPVMICINARFVDGKNVEEPAAKGLREVVYRDPRVVTKSRLFVCVFLTPEGSSGDYGELRARFAIDGNIVSPQHIFALPDHADGTAPLVRREYWSYGKDEPGVQALLEMMDKALGEFRARHGVAAPPGESPPAGEPGPVAAPPGDAERAAWIAQTVAGVTSGDTALRREALQALAVADREGDCLRPLLPILADEQHAKDAALLGDVVRTLGRPGFFEAAAPIEALLKHRDEGLRANAAVSLEYVGCPESVKELGARAAREKVVLITNHLYRALGRCGAGDAKVRERLLKEVKGADSEEASFGPIVGLAYFAKDEKAARGVEKLLKQMGPPSGGRRGGGEGTQKRALLAWCLSEIGDPESAAFMREEMIAPMENTIAWWKDAVVAYYQSVARVCAGEEEARGGVDTGIRATLEFTGGTARFRGEAREGRETGRFQPKGEWELEARSFGGGGGGGGGGGR